jgi:hypothetical protein
VRRWAIVAALAAASVWATAGVLYELKEVRTADRPSQARLEKIIVVGMSDDSEVRHRFEDKLVTFLSGRGGKAMTSYPLVPSFKAIGDREHILQVLAEEGVDGVLTVRAVPMDDVSEAQWAGAWKATLAKGLTVREFIEQNLPMNHDAVKRFGVEFALWDRRTPGAIWSARSGVYTRNQLRAGVSDLLALVINEMRAGLWF